MSYAGKMASGDERGGRGGGRRNIYIYILREISIRRRRTSNRLERSVVLGGSRTKLLKMDEISDLPASGLPARSSRAIRQVSRRWRRSRAYSKPLKRCSKPRARSRVIIEDHPD